MNSISQLFISVIQASDLQLHELDSDLAQFYVDMQEETLRQQAADQETSRSIVFLEQENHSNAF